MSARSHARAARYGIPAALVGLVAALAGCSAPVSVQPAADAANPACAPLMLALPDTIGDAQLRTTTSQATAAWGDPAAVVLRCGVPSPGPTTDRCVSVNGVDWVIRQDSPATPGASSPGASSPGASSPGAAAGGAAGAGDGGTYTLTTFGREPATELLLDASRASSATVLASLSPAVAKIPATRHCVGQEDLATLPAKG
ncbi:hypothetical protein SA2016_2418 [Sinomonas atrocyanea]|uniref:Secreted protein n=1 Tax=Sinomonas atrocyanea TaxID=37927 RepID=A0A127A1N1_9MICC|nr:DUF3515 family protein [Sinomonas atrocyanea]AMM33087.1 hypothetical protein SA2016_2418 [Sinomonas atrocyanea]GEB65370.1 hypothetical protein SAT01_28180 [Sinomonas atrocyanea]GGG73433.1 hypothetical protein GCM10007172_27500 [Sinomonas atrocyanea]